MNRAHLGINVALVMGVAACAGTPSAGPQAKPPVSSTAEASQPPVENAAASNKETPPPLPCPKEIFGPAMITAEQALLRHGSGLRLFSEVKTTIEKPVEVCKARGEYEFLSRMRCENGEPAYASVKEIRDSRAGNMGPGGRCGNIIDLYKVPCPETTYAIHLDMYFCMEREM